MRISYTLQITIKYLSKIFIAIVAGISIFLLLSLLFPLHIHIDYSPVIRAQDGTVLNSFLTTDDKWRMYTELDEISPLLQKTIIAKEDKHFFSHPGVNIFAIAKALATNLLHLKTKSGASTITMQVARALSHRKRTIISKMIEAFRAVQLEMRYSKKEILQLYLNLLPYGSNIEGVKAASILYFNKNPNHLSLAEITALSIIPNRPSSLLIGRNNDYIVQQRNKWLHRFASENVFSAKEIDDALAEPLTARRGTVPHYAPHLSRRLRNGGSHNIETTININNQLKTEKLVADYIRTQQLHNIHNAAVLVVDNATGQVVTYVGSANFYDTTDAGQVDGVRAIRQPGSTLKPLLYGLCFDQGIYTPKSVVTDVPVNYEGFAPENFDQKFNGFVTIEYALEHSLNIPAVKSLKALGKDAMLQKLLQCNFEQIRKDQKKLGLSLILGGCGTTLEELTGLFSAFAREGAYIRPSYLKTSTSKGVGQKVTSPCATFLINEILSKVNRPDFPVNWTVTEHMPKIAWKTGTSYGRRDAWSIGYNKRYTVGVWVGNFSGAGVADLSGATTATPLLFKIFNTLDYNSDEQWFHFPADCDSRIVCSETGLPPADFCTNLITDNFIPLISPSAKCNHLQEVVVSADEKISYCKACMPPSGYKKKLYRNLPPEMLSWYIDNSISYERIPQHNTACERIFNNNVPIIQSPLSGTEYFISSKHPEPLQLSCKAAADVSRIYWYIDNKFYKSAQPGEKIFFLPVEGIVKISCTDDKGRNRDIKITVKYVTL